MVEEVEPLPSRHVRFLPSSLASHCIPSGIPAHFQPSDLSSLSYCQCRYPASSYKSTHPTSRSLPKVGPSIRQKSRVRVYPRAAANGGSEPSDIAASAAAADGSKGGEEEEARGASTMPSRFRYLTKEAPDRPVRWPWLIVLAFLIYAWRTVLWELTNWKKAVLAIAGFCGYLLKLVLAIIYLFIGDPITTLIRYIETSLYFVRSVYASIVAYAPVQELSVIIMLASTVLAIAEATVPDSVNSQPYILSLAGLIGFWAVGGFIPELLFWLLLSGLFCYSRFAKKRDNVSAALPVAAVAAAVGEPWVRVLAIASYLTLAIFQHSKSSEGNVEVGAPSNRRRLPLPLLFSALAIGIHVAAKWVRYRHLTWKVL